MTARRVGSLVLAVTCLLGSGCCYWEGLERTARHADISADLVRDALASDARWLLTTSQRRRAMVASCAWDGRIVEVLVVPEEGSIWLSSRFTGPQEAWPAEVEEIRPRLRMVYERVRAGGVDLPPWETTKETATRPGARRQAFSRFLTTLAVISQVILAILAAAALWIPRRRRPASELPRLY